MASKWQKTILLVLWLMIFVFGLASQAAYAETCDVDANGKVDFKDIFGIQVLSNGQLANGAGDPSDADGNGIINNNDVRICKTLCTPAGCPGLTNRRPRALNDSATTALNQRVTIDLVANDRDFDGRLAVSKLRIVAKPRHGRVTNHRNGTVTYRPARGYLGGDVFRYEIKDNQGAVSNVARVRVTVSNQPPLGNNPISTSNLPPVANAGADINAATNTSVILDGSQSSDPEGGQLSFSWQFLTVPAGSAATIANNQSPTPNFTPNVDGVYDVVLTVSDGANASTGTVRVTATTANVPPNVTLNTPNPQPALVGFDITPDISFTVTDNDGPNALALSWSFVQPLPAGSALTNASITNPPPPPNSNLATASFIPDVVGVYTLRLSAFDGAAPPSTADVVINAEINTPPIANAGANITVPFPLPAAPPNNTVVLNGSGTDQVVGPDVPLHFTWSFVGLLPPGSALTNNDITGRLTANPIFIPDSLGEYTLSLTVDDGDPAVVPTPDNVVVKANAAPVAVDDSYTMTRDTTLNEPTVSGLLANDTDGNGDDLIVVRDPSDTGPTNGTLTFTPVDFENGSFSYVPNPGFEGTDSFTYRVNDRSNILPPYVPNAISAPATVNITVEPPNAAPILTASGVTPSFTENIIAGALDGGVTVTDTDDTNLESATVTITNVLDAGKETLTAITAGTSITITSIVGPTLTLTGTDTKANYQQVLRSVSYNNSSENPNTTTRVISFTANDGSANSIPATVSLTVNSVNDRPSFTAANPAAANEDTGAQTVPNWVTAFNPGHPDESAQTVLNYTVNNVSVPTLFAVPPTVDASGTLSYTPAPNAFGTSTFDVSVKDNGGTANGGIDASVVQQFTITVNAVNDVPSFTAVNPPPVNEDAGAQAVNAWAAFNPGNAQESTQAVSAYLISNVSNSGLFSGQPTVNASGVLSYTPALNANGTSTFQVAVQDNGGTANGGVDTSSAQTFTITVNAVNDPPIARSPAPSYTGNANLNFVMADDGGDGAGGILDLLDGATDPDGATTLSLVAGTITTTAGGSVTVSTDGSFSYQPPAGFVGNDSFTYQIQDNGIPLPAAIANVVATIAVSDTDGAGAGTSVLWFIDEDATASSNIGTQANPFRSLAAFNVANTGAGNNPADADFIFLNDDALPVDNNGDGAGIYGGGIALRAGQRLIGDGSSGTLGAIIGINLGSFNSLIPFSGIDPTIGGGITLNSGNTLRGVIGGSAGGFSISGGAVGNLTISESAINNATGGGISITTSGALTVTLDSLTSAGGTNGINLIGMTGNFTANGGAVSGSTGTAFNVSGGTGVITYGGTITKANSAQRPVAVANKTGGSVTFTGTITANTDTVPPTFPLGISLTNNTGSTVNFQGGLALSTGANPAFTATGGGTVNVTGAANTLATTTGTALNVANTTIGASGLTFQSISANGATNGIVLNTTGASGGLTVTGTGAANSGGTIQNTTGSAIALTSTQNVSLTRMLISNPGNHGIDISNLSGTNLIDNSTITAFNVVNTNGINLLNSTGTLTQFRVNASTFSNSPTGNSGIFTEFSGAANATVLIEGGSSFTNLFNNGVQVSTQTGSSGAISATIRNSSFTSAAANGLGGILITPFGGPNTFTFSVNNNTFTNLMQPISNQGLVNFTNGDLDGSGPTVNGVVSNNSVTNVVGGRGLTNVTDTFSGPTDIVMNTNTINTFGDNKSVMLTSARNSANTDVTINNNIIGSVPPLFAAGQEATEVVFMQTQNGARLDASADSNTITANTTFEVLRGQAQATSLLNTTFTNNTVTDTQTTRNEIDFTILNNATTAILCVDVRGNSVGGAAGNIDLQEGTAAGVAMNVEQSSVANTSTLNNGANVTTSSGTPQFSQADCPLP